MYKVNDLVEHKKSGVTYKVLYTYNDVLFAVNDKDVAKSMGIDDVVSAKSEREKFMEMFHSDMVRMPYITDHPLAEYLYNLGYRKIDSN